MVNLAWHRLSVAVTSALAPAKAVETAARLFSTPPRFEHTARELGIPEPVRRALQERFERSLGQRWSQFELPQAVADVRAQALVVHDASDREVGQSGGIALARAWLAARFFGTRGLGHRLILRDATVVRDAVDFLAGEVGFAPPPARGAAAFSAPAPIL